MSKIENGEANSPKKTVNCSTGHVRHGDAIMTLVNKNSFFYCVKDPLGIHARPAGAIAKIASGFSSQITIYANGKSARADSIISIMSLGAKSGTELKVLADGKDAQEALEVLKSFLRENL